LQESHIAAKKPTRLLGYVLFSFLESVMWTTADKLRLSRFRIGLSPIRGVRRSPGPNLKSKWRCRRTSVGNPGTAVSENYSQIMSDQVCRKRLYREAGRSGGRVNIFGRENAPLAIMTLVSLAILFVFVASS
jgi:hypothetical protein